MVLISLFIVYQKNRMILREYTVLVPDTRTNMVVIVQQYALRRGPSLDQVWCYRRRAL